MAESPPSYDEALGIGSGKGSPSNVVEAATAAHSTTTQPTAPPYHATVQPTAPPYHATVQPNVPPYHTTVQPTAPQLPIANEPTVPPYLTAVQPDNLQYPSATVHEVERAQPTGTDFTREDEATIVDEASNFYLKYPRCFNCFVGLAAKPLPPTLRKAWAMGVRDVTKTAAIGKIPRYLFLAAQSIVVLIAFVFSFLTTTTYTINVYAAVGSLSMIVLINILERFFYWCLHAVAKKDKDGTWNFCADITRTIVTEIFLYIGFIFTLQEATTSESYQTFFSEKRVNSSNLDDDLSYEWDFFLLGVIGVAFVLTAGVMRMYLVIYCVKSLFQARKSNKSSATFLMKTLLYGFCIYTATTCVIQALLIVFVGMYFHEVSLHQGAIEDSATYDSGLKWYFAFFTELIPLGGLFLFFIVTQKLVEEFPIAFLLDISPQQEQRRNISMGVVALQFKALHSKNKSKTGILENIFYPLTSPLQGLFHMIFFILCSYFVMLLFSVSFSASLQFQIVGTLASVLMLVIYFLSLVHGLVSIIMCAYCGICLYPLFLFSCIKPNVIRDVSVRDLF